MKYLPLESAEYIFVLCRYRLEISVSSLPFCRQRLESQNDFGVPSKVSERISLIPNGVHLRAGESIWSTARSTMSELLCANYAKRLLSDCQLNCVCHTQDEETINGCLSGDHSRGRSVNRISLVPYPLLSCQSHSVFPRCYWQQANRITCDFFFTRQQ